MIQEKETIMETRNKWSKRKTARKTCWLLVAIVLMLMCVQQVSASTAANTTVTNTVTVTYDDATGTNSYTDTAVATFIVLLRAAAPTISSPADIDPTTEATANTLTYTITSNANGEDDYLISTAIANVDLSGETVVINGGSTSITLGGTTLAADVAIGAGSITVPYDSDADGDNTATNGITATDTIIIGGNPYVVSSISEDSGTNITTIGIVGTIAGAAGSIGDVVGEQFQFPIVVTTGTLSAGISNGTHTVTATATSSADNSQFMDQLVDTVITVRRPLLSITKYVQDIVNPVIGSGASYAVDTGSGPLTYYENINVVPLPATVLEYIIVVSNSDPNGGQADNVVISDPIPQFTSYVPNSMRIDPGTGAFSPLGDAAADPDEGEYDSGSKTIWIYAGSGGDDGAGGYGDGNGGTLAAGDTTIGVFQVTLE
jgi:uncharacterized repeat protein (TIGR01451 family)